MSYPPIARKQSRKGTRQTPSRRRSATQGDGAAFAGQQVVTLTLPCDPVVITTDGGGLASGRQIVIPSSLIDNWLSFYGVFQEYRILNATFEITALGHNPGVSVFAVREVEFTTPTYDTITSSTNWVVPNSSSNPRSHKVIRWRAIDLEDLEYYDVRNDVGVMALNWYTNTTTFNAPASQPLFMIRTKINVEFRGIGTTL